MANLLEQKVHAVTSAGNSSVYMSTSGAALRGLGNGCAANENPKVQILVTRAAAPDPKPLSDGINQFFQRHAIVPRCVNGSLYAFSQIWFRRLICGDIQRLFRRFDDLSPSSFGQMSASIRHFVSMTLYRGQRCTRPYVRRSAELLRRRQRQKMALCVFKSNAPPASDA
jgi:hypothetical protein